MSEYKHLDKFMEKKGKTPKVKKDKVKKSKITNKERDELIDQMLADFEYIE